MAERIAIQIQGLGAALDAVLNAAIDPLEPRLRAGSFAQRLAFVTAIHVVRAGIVASFVLALLVTHQLLNFRLALHP